MLPPSLMALLLSHFPLVWPVVTAVAAVIVALAAPALSVSPVAVAAVVTVAAEYLLL